MMAAELYPKTLSGDKASSSKGATVSLSRYCQLYHVNNRGLRYWMKKSSINTANGKPEKAAVRSIPAATGLPVTSPGHMLPLQIQSPLGEKAKRSPRENRH